MVLCLSKGSGDSYSILEMSDIPFNRSLCNLQISALVPFLLDGVPGLGCEPGQGLHFHSGTASICHGWTPVPVRPQKVSFCLTCSQDHAHEAGRSRFFSSLPSSVCLHLYG